MAGSVQACDRLHRREVLTEEAAKSAAPDLEAKILGPMERAEPVPDLAAMRFFLVAPRASKDGPATHLALTTRPSRVRTRHASKTAASAIAEEILPGGFPDYTNGHAQSPFFSPCGAVPSRARYVLG